MEQRGILKYIESKINYRLLTKIVVFTAIATLSLTGSTKLVHPFEKIKDPNALVIMTTGDIVCNKETEHNTPDCQAEKVAEVITNQNPDKVIITGDVSHKPTNTSYNIDFEKLYGDLKKDIISVPGNHDYEDENKTAEQYYDYFNGVGNEDGQAGEIDKGYYSADIIKGDLKVHITAINTECGKVGGCGKDSPQYKWIKDDLGANTALCNIIVAHKPFFSSGSQATKELKDIFDLASNYDVDLFLTGHEHFYERFSPYNGITEIIVGTGGTSHSWYGKKLKNEVTRNNNTFGALRLAVNPEKPNQINFEFIPVKGKTFTDAGVIFCH